MKSHDLARLLLSLPDLPVATHANNHTHASGESRFGESIAVGILEHYTAQHVAIGNFCKRMLNPTNWWISEAISCELPDEWNEKPYPGLTTGNVRRYAQDQKRLKLCRDGIDRFSTGTIGEVRATVDARGGPPEPQFGGKWAGSAYRADVCIARTERIYATFQEAARALDDLLKPHDLSIYRTEEPAYP